MLSGEPNIFSELEFAVSTLPRLQYQGCSEWEVHIVHRFIADGIKFKIYVQPAALAEIFSFTDYEAIAIAASLPNKQNLDLGQEEQDK